MKKEDLYHHLIMGRLPHVSLAINWTAKEREAIANSMSAKKVLNDNDLANIESLVKDAQKKINSAVNNQYANAEERYIIFTGGWHCEPLKKYLKSKGYEIMACGNSFDIWA